jgi:phospholipase C
MKLRGSHKWLALAAAALAVPLIGGQPVSAAQPSITLSSSSAPPTGRVSVKGIRGFQPAEMVELYFDSTDVDYTIAAGTGGFGFTAVNIPTSAAPGPHWITAVGRTSGASAQASVWVSGAWQLAGQTDTGERFNKFENVISRKNATSLQPSWTGSVDGAAATPVIGFDNVRRTPIVVETSDGGTIAAFDATGCGSATCAPLWTGDAGGPIAGSAVIDGQNVIVATQDGTIASFPLTGCGSATCTPDWTGSAGSAIDDSPSLAHDSLGPGRDLVLVGTDGAKIVAFDGAGCGAATCAPAWSSSVTGGAVKVSPISGVDPVSNTAFVFVVSQTYVSAFNLHTGAVKWKKPVDVDPGTRPAYAPNVFLNMGLLFVVTNGQLQALKGQNGAPKWNSNDTAGDPLISSPSVSISRVYVASATHVYSYDAGARRCSSCHSIWRGSTPNANTDPSVANGVVYEGTTDGRVLGFIASGCVKLAGDCNNPVYSSDPVGAAVSGLVPMVNGNLFVPAQDGVMHVLGLASPPSPPSAPNPSSLTPIAGPIRHVVIIDQENHSFDETLGYMCVNELQGRCDGATTGKLLDGTTIPLTQATDVIPAVSHNNTAQTNAINGGLMNGFEKVSGCQKTKNYRCYTQFHPDQIPSLSDLARNYVISDRTFQTEITATFGSHMLLGSGTLDGFTGDFPQSAPNFPAGPGWGCDSLMDGPWRSSPGAAVTLVPSCVPSADGSGPYKPSPVQHVGPTLMDRLDDAELSWKIYEGGQLWSNGDVWTICPTFADCLFSTQSANVTKALDVADDGNSGSLPNVSLVMPRPGGYSQHNGTSMMKGDNWISQVVSSIMNGPDWQSTAIFITYDDCGCFYDHVPPPAGRGERLPMVIVSPYAKAQFTDHGSTGMVGMLSYIEHRFGIAPLTNDDATAYDYSNSFDYNQTPLAPIPLTQHTVPAATIAYLKEHPPTAVDPV